MSKKILVLNLGSTSTKVAIFKDLEPYKEETIRHPLNELEEFDDVFAQDNYRKKYILEFLKECGLDLNSFDCIISRGGTWKPLPSGVLKITDEMIKDVKSGNWGIHASGLGCAIALELSREYNIPAISANSPTVDELQPFARYTGLKGLEKISILHALNHKAIANRFAKEHDLNYEDLNMIIVHLGGGISVVAHSKGRMIDTNNALDGDGPFSPERTGSLPVGALTDMCFSGEFTHKEIRRKIVGEGGLVSYLGTNNGIEIANRIEAGDEEAKEVFEAMAYQVAKEMGSMAVVLKGDVDAIIFTGGLSYSEHLTSFIGDMTNWIAPVYVYPGEDELQALAENAVDFLDGKAELLDYDAY